MNPAEQVVASGRPATPFSPSDAALEGFQVLRRHWRVVVGWALFNVTALIAMGIVGAVIGFGAAASASAGAMTFNPLLGRLLGLIGEAFVIAMITTGLFRLMLRPEEPGFLHLRIGADELRLMGVWLIMILAGFMLIGVSAALVVSGGGFGPQMALAAWLFVAGVGVWLAVRFSLSAVVTFAERRFALRQGWRLTRGHSWSLLGMAVLSGTVTLLIGMLVGLAIFLLMALSVGLGAMVEATFSPDGPAAHPRVYVAEFFIQLVLFPAFTVLLMAPWVSAYEALRGETAAA